LGVNVGREIQTGATPCSGAGFSLKEKSDPMTIRLLVADSTVRDHSDLDGLAAAGISPFFAGSLPETVQLVRTDAPHAILAYVDTENASLSCAILRALGDTPLIVVSSGLPSDVVRECLERGADYVLPDTLPLVELCAWIRAAVRRSTEQPATPRQNQVMIADLTIDLYTRRVWRHGIAVDLTRREFQLLSVLAEHPGRVVENHELLTRVWGPEYVNDVQNVRQYMGYLRNKLEDDPRRPECILTVRGIGYRLAESHEDMPAVPKRRTSSPPCGRADRRSIRTPVRRPVLASEDHHPTLTRHASLATAVATAMP
jgi:two-component system KDP operon response regulator KdpE